jgi:hypothetical protein
LLHPPKPVKVPSLLNVRVIWTLGITGIDPAMVAPLKFQFPVSAGSVAGPEITTMAAVGAGVGAGVAVVTGVGTGAGVVVHPAARIPTNKTAQTKNSKDFIAQNIMIFY